MLSWLPAMMPLKPFWRSLSIWTPFCLVIASNLALTLCSRLCLFRKAFFRALILLSFWGVSISTLSLFFAVVGVHRPQATSILGTAITAHSRCSGNQQFTVAMSNGWGVYDAINCDASATVQEWDNFFAWWQEFALSTLCHFNEPLVWGTSTNFGTSDHRYQLLEVIKS